MRKLRVAFKRLRRDSRGIILLVMLASILLQVAGMSGVAFFILAGLLSLSAVYPKSFRTLTSRFLLSMFVVFTSLQIAAAFQFMVLPQSDFSILGIILSLTVACFAFILRSGNKLVNHKKSDLISTADISALIGASMWLVPVALFALLAPLDRLQEVGGLQGVDGVNHFVLISAKSEAEQLGYARGNGFYHGGFHIAIAYVQESLGINQGALEWGDQARLYFMQYAVLGASLLWLLYYLAVTLITFLKSYISKSSASITIPILIVAPAILVYLPLFTYNGFLSYFYIIMSIVASLVYFTDIKISKWKGLFGGLIVAVGASMNWPLLAPAILLAAFLLFIYLNRESHNQLSIVGHMLLIIVAGVHFIPVYFQLVYSADATSAINLDGGLYDLNSGVLLLGVLALLFLIKTSTLDSGRKDIIGMSFLPYLLLLVCLIAMQLMLLGEVRYYTLKTSLLVEVLLIPVMAVAAVACMNKFQAGERQYLFAKTPAIVFSIMILASSLSGVNPFEGLRSLARAYSNTPYPAYLKSDVEKVAVLGGQDKIESSNVITLHTNDQGVFYAHSQVFYWAQAMSFDGTHEDYKYLKCGHDIYSNQFTQNFSPRAQQEMISKIKECIYIAKENRRDFYIVTDEKSGSDIIRTFGNSGVKLL